MFCATLRGQREYATVKGHQFPFTMNSESQQISVGDLFWTEPVAPSHAYRGEAEDRPSRNDAFVPIGSVFVPGGWLRAPKAGLR